MSASVELIYNVKYSLLEDFFAFMASLMLLIYEGFPKPLVTAALSPPWQFNQALAEGVLIKEGISQYAASVDTRGSVEPLSRYA